MKDYNTLYNYLIEEIQDILSRHELSPQQLLCSTSPNHLLFHEELIELLSCMVETIDDIDELKKENSKRNRLLFEAMEKELIGYSKSQCSDMSAICHIINTYLAGFMNKYLTLKNGKIIRTNKESFQLPKNQTSTFDDFEDNYHYIISKLGNIYLNPNREICLIIMPDGTCYNALNDHLTCARWLNLNNIDIDHAIRFESSKQFYDFDFCSLHNYNFSTKSDNNEFIEITPEQAIIITDLYKALQQGWAFLKPLSSSITKSNGFGFGYKDFKSGLGQKNLSLIAEHSKGYFDDYDYLKELKSKKHIESTIPR